MDFALRTPTQARLQLRALRKARGLTQAQLGVALGVTQARIAEIEANPAVVGLQQVMEVLNALGAYLVVREDVEDGAPRLSDW